MQFDLLIPLFHDHKSVRLSVQSPNLEHFNSSWGVHFTITTVNYIPQTSPSELVERWLERAKLPVTRTVITDIRYYNEVKCVSVLRKWSDKELLSSKCQSSVVYARGIRLHREAPFRTVNYCFHFAGSYFKQAEGKVLDVANQPSLLLNEFSKSEK